jgi:hypothetical protein
MHIGTAGLVKHPGKEEFVRIKERPADRAFPLSGTASLKAVDTSLNMHKPAPVIPRIGKHRRFYEFPVFQEDAADRAASRRTGAAFPKSFGPLFITPKWMPR